MWVAYRTIARWRVVTVCQRGHAASPIPTIGAAVLWARSRPAELGPGVLALGLPASREALFGGGRVSSQGVRSQKSAGDAPRFGQQDEHALLDRAPARFSRYQANALPVKDAYVYPLHQRYREILTAPSRD